MGKDEKEDSGFGFKDKAKAVETLRLLEQHDANYRRLTVRGLLGRAKRVLSMTKAEDKIKNIKEAMEVFEQWLADLDANKKTDKPDKKDTKKEEKKKEEKKKEKEEKSGSDESSSASDVEMEDKKASEKKELPSESVPGLGFKDRAAAEGTLKELEGRDPDYQRLAVKGLIGRAKRVLTCTRDETKISNIKEAMAIFEKFLDDFESLHLSKQNNPYISLGHVRTAEKLAGDTVTELQRSFIAAYSGVSGEYKRLRSVRAQAGDCTWDVVRNRELQTLKEKHAEAKLFTDKDEPTAEHLQMLLWAYSPEPARVKKYLPETKEDREDRKRRSSGREEESPSKRSKQ
ncbi:DNA ligase 1-like [Spodoptera litura]|uniref:DNA ligase 1-like n=1 Tax=Spodoptera litura TaxID=69820 RepID=A0A9J7ELR3_SPOLT|nr:DNA ligase 1-like [Spodoptera litura]